MKLEAFHALTRTRIPTAQEFVDFVRASGWSIVQRERGACLRAPVSPLTSALAKMLGREPYRTNVLALVLDALPDVPTEARLDAISVPAPEKTQPVPMPSTPAAETCRTCAANWEPSATPTDKALLCDKILTCPYNRTLDWPSVPSYPMTRDS